MARSRAPGLNYFWELSRARYLAKQLPTQTARRHLAQLIGFPPSPAPAVEIRGMKPWKSVLYSAQETLQAPIFVVSPAETRIGVCARKVNMSAGAAPAPVTATSYVQRRRAVRHSIAVPVDLTVLRSGVPDSIPGRTVDVGEHGVAAVIAAELHPGDLVGLEFRLPSVGTRLRAKAVVRHQERLHCGLEFLGLSMEQRAMIRYWAERGEQPPAARDQMPVSGPPASDTKPAEASPEMSAPEPRRVVALHRALAIALAAFVVIGGLGWWQWYAAWKELESRVSGSEVTNTQPAAKVPSAVMEQLVTHKVEPVYPASARQANVQGTVVLDTVIGPDGTVVDVRPVSGPDVLATAAVDAVRWWRFQPYQIKGQPAQVETTVAVEFRP